MSVLPDGVPLDAKLAVLGSPIVHSKSPELHRAAYRALGLEWSYDRIELSEAELADFLERSGSDYWGFSVTMPLKHELVRLASERDALVQLTGSANTAVGLSTGRLAVFNTDVAGIVRACAHYGVTAARHAVVLGAGATASSALAALAELGVESVDIRVRTVTKAEPLRALGNRLGLAVSLGGLAPEELRELRTDLLVSTLPAGASDDFAGACAGMAPVLFDVAYVPWPSALASRTRALTVVPGLEMLLQQALVQVRIFVLGSPMVELPNETAVLRAMREALPAL